MLLWLVTKKSTASRIGLATVVITQRMGTSPALGCRFRGRGKCLTENTFNLCFPFSVDAKCKNLSEASSVWFSPAWLPFLPLLALAALKRDGDAGQVFVLMDKGHVAGSRALHGGHDKSLPVA